MKALHRAGIELIWNSISPAHTYPGLMVDCLKYWLLEYHVDGFHISGFDLPLELIAREPLLAASSCWAMGSGRKRFTRTDICRRCGVWRRCTTGRRWICAGFLRGEEGQIGGFAARLRNNPTDRAVVNYVASHNGFRLVMRRSTTRPTGKTTGTAAIITAAVITAKRERAGKEDQRHPGKAGAQCPAHGISRPGCAVSPCRGRVRQQPAGQQQCLRSDDPNRLIQYDRSRAGDFLRRFTEKLIAFRKAHRVFHQAGELQGMDVSGCGCPDISFHGRHVWYPEFDGVSRQLGYSMREPVWETVIFTRHIICMEGRNFCAAPSAQRHVLGAGHRHVSPEAEMFPESPGAKGVGGAERNDCKKAGPWWYWKVGCREEKMTQYETTEAQENGICGKENGGAAA